MQVWEIISRWDLSADFKNVRNRFPKLRGTRRNKIQLLGSPDIRISSKAYVHRYQPGQGSCPQYYLLSTDKDYGYACCYDSVWHCRYYQASNSRVPNQLFDIEILKIDEILRTKVSFFFKIYRVFPSLNFF